MNQIRVKIRNTFWLIIVSFVAFVFLTIPVTAQDAQTFYQNGYQYFSQGNYQKAEENYKKAIELNGDFEDAHYWLGKVYRQTG
ncbi:MAG: tetratricopeptide repeat protein, partial [Candidatus Atribacteria bacterium]|nr:tetratricopeptide repeat protein [Candidatus Atribacteria bacterium]